MTKTFYLKKNNENSIMKDINNSDINKILALQDKIYSYLKPNEKSYIVPKTEEQWINFIEAPQNKLVGVFLENKDELIGTTAVCCPTVNNDSTHLDAFQPKDLLRSAIMLGSKVDPEYRGNGLQKIMTSIREDWAQSLGRDTFLSEIQVNNFHSWVNLLKTGYSIVGRVEIVEHDEIVPLYVAQKKLNKHEFLFGSESISMDLNKFFIQEKALFKNNIGAISYNDNIKSLKLGRIEQSTVYDITKISKGATYGL